MRKRFVFLSLLVLALGLVAVSVLAASQPPGVELNPTGLSRISWMFETPQDEWVITKSVEKYPPGDKRLEGHEGDDYYADDWAKKDGKTKGQIAYAGISGQAIVLPFDAKGYGNHVVIYDSSSGFALRYAHLDEVLVSNEQTVVAGSTPIGKVGNTGWIEASEGSDGSHLHIVLYKNVKDVNKRPITRITFNRSDPEVIGGPPTEFAAPFLYNPRVKPGETPVTKAEIRVEDAGVVWEAGLIPSSGLVAAAQVVPPRIVVEYAGCSFSQGLAGSVELNETAKPIPPKITVEYAEVYFSRKLVRVSAAGLDIAGVEERTLSITPAEVSPGSSVTVQLSITDAADIAGGDILVRYDANIVTVGEVKATDLIAGMSLVVNKDVLGELTLSMAGAQGITSGSGALVEIALTVSAEVKANTATILEFGDDTEIYDKRGESIPVSLKNGVLKIPGICTKGDVNDDGQIRSDDAILTLRIAAGLITATVQQECAADMNEDGKVRANDAIAIMQKAAGLGAPGAGIAASASRQITVALAEAHGVAGQTVTVPLKVDSTYGLAGGNICITYDPAVLQAVDVSSDLGSLLVSNTAEPGVVRIAFASAGSLTGETLAELRFSILADDVSPLKLKVAELYRPDTLPIDVRRLDGRFASWAVAPEHNALLQNYPNPFNPETWIPYQLREASEVTVQIYSTAGNLVRELNLGYRPAGVYVSRDRAAYWDGRNASGEQAASGVYFYHLQAGEFAKIKKMVIVR